jgi:ferrous iron transport protein A
MSVASTTQVVPLDLLQAHESGQILEVVAPDEWTHRLQELGLREGVTIRMVKPGEPCILAIDGHRFSYRCDPSTMIMVELAESAV